MLTDSFRPAATSSSRCAHQGLIEVDWEAYSEAAKHDRHVPKWTSTPASTVSALNATWWSSDPAARCPEAVSWANEGARGNPALGPHRKGAQIFLPEIRPYQPVLASGLQQGHHGIDEDTSASEDAWQLFQEQTRETPARSVTSEVLQAVVRVRS